MAYLRLTMLRPRQGAEAEAQSLLEALDASLAKASALLFSLVLQQEGGTLGRISLWQSKEDANREAVSGQTLALRSQLRFLSVAAEETLMEVKSGSISKGLSTLAASMRLSAGLPSASRQKVLLAS